MIITDETRTKEFLQLTGLHVISQPPRGVAGKVAKLFHRDFCRLVPSLKIVDLHRNQTNPAFAVIITSALSLSLAAQNSFLPSTVKLASPQPFQTTSYAQMAGVSQTPPLKHTRFAAYRTISCVKTLHPSADA